ncbi:MAG: ribbon-helix-helix domain-containing protein [Candidatus Omnitrophica bacterium]|nr:ribbon-helix-helix domain-containing protein [Candidatus Omnitrophota bacterium]
MLKPFATKLDEKVIQKLDEIAQKTQIPKSRLCRQAIELLAAHYERVEENMHMGEKVRQRETVSVSDSLVQEVK